LFKAIYFSPLGESANMASLIPPMKYQSSSTKQGVTPLFSTQNVASTQSTQEVVFVEVMDKQLEKRLNTIEAKIKALDEQVCNQPKIYNTQLIDLGSSVYELDKPLPIVIEVYEDEVVALIPELNLYASSVSDDIAIAKLKEEVISTYLRLLELGNDRLGPLALGSLNTLSRLIVKHNA